MCWKLNKWKYVFLLWTLIIIKQYKGVIMISGKRYNTHNMKSKIFILFTGVTEPFIYSQWIEFGLNLHYSYWGWQTEPKTAGRHQSKCIYNNHSSQKYRQIKQNHSRKVSKLLELVLFLIWVCHVCKNFSKLYLQK